MAWNYRVIKDTYKDDKSEHVFYRLAEVYYDKEGNPDSFSLSHDMLQAEDKDELFEILGMLSKAFDKPTLSVHKDRIKEEVI